MIQSTFPANASQSELWPNLEFETWKDTYATLYRWTQIVGKIRLSHLRGSIIHGTWLRLSWVPGIVLHRNPTSRLALYSAGSRTLP